MLHLGCLRRSVVLPGAGKVGVALSASLSGGVTHAGRRVFWSGHAENKGLSPLGLAPPSLNSSCVLLFVRPKEGLLALWWSFIRSGETQNIPLPLNHPWWLVLRLHTMGSVLLLVMRAKSELVTCET